MAWDKTKPVTNSDLLSAEIRANWDALDLALMAPLAGATSRALFVRSASGLLVPVDWLIDANNVLSVGLGTVPSPTVARVKAWISHIVPSDTASLHVMDEQGNIFRLGCDDPGNGRGYFGITSNGTAAGIIHDGTDTIVFGDGTTYQIHLSGERVHIAGDGGSDFLMRLLFASGRLQFNTAGAGAVIEINADKVLRLIQDGMGITGLALNYGSLHSHYNLVLGTENYPDTGTGMLALGEPVALPTTPAPGLVLLYGTDIAGAGTKGLLIKSEDGFIHRIGKGHQFPVLSVVPGTPPAGYVVSYAKSDKKMYQKDDAGLETILTANNPMTTVGDVIVGGASGAPTRLAAVATGAVLASAGVAAAPTWSTTPSLSSLTLTARLVQARVTVTYSASMTLDASLGSQFIITVTNGTAFTINAPTNPVLGQEIFIRIRNTSGGAAGAATWNSVFKLATWTQPANGTSRTIHYMYDGSNWVETTRTTVDVPN